jgi:hypothetical protein
MMALGHTHLNEFKYSFRFVVPLGKWVLDVLPLCTSIAYAFMVTFEFW